MNIGINLLFVRPGKIGGGESYIKNLLCGFTKKVNKNFNFSLLVPKALCKSWEDYENNDNFHIVNCALDNTSAIKRISYETLFLNNILKKNKIDILFNPVYSKSVVGKPIVPCISVIHDLQALHYPGYFNKFKLIWLK